MNILITGASGFSGSHIFNYLVAREYRTFAHKGRTHGDLRNPVSWATMDLPEAVDVIIHTAAVSPGVGITNRHLCDNIRITQNLIDYAKNHEVKKIIYFSSDSLYGSVRRPVLEENCQIVNPSVYGCSKILCEALLSECGIPTISLRLPLIVGKGAKRNWLARMMEDVKKYQPVKVYNPNAQFNNVVHIKFLCEFVEKLIKMDWDFKYEPTLLGSSSHMSVHEVAERLCTGRVPIVDALKKTHSHTISIVNMSKFLQPWTIDRTIDEYVKEEL